MLTFDWKFLFVFGLLGITITGIWLMINGSREKGWMVVWSQFRVHLGIALLISAITIVLIDLQLERKVEADLDRFPQVMLKIICKGDSDLVVAINKQINDPIRYTDVKIDAQLKRDMSSNPKHSTWVWTTEFNVRNISDADVDWEFCPTVTSDLEGNPNIHIGKPVVKEIGHDDDITEATCEAKYSEDRSSIESKAQYKTTIRLKPGVTYHVLVARAADDRLDKGYTTHFFTKISNHVKFTLTVDPELFAVKVEPFYPGGKEKILTPTLKGRGPIPHTSYEISETLFPYQGLQVFWTYKGAKPAESEGSTNSSDQGL